MYLSVLAGFTQLFAIHENGEGLLPLILPDQEVSTMLQTVLGNAYTSSGKYPVYIHVEEQRQIYLILFFFGFLRHHQDSSILSGFMRAITI